MTFKQAHAKILKIADGKYYSLGYDLSTHSDGRQTSQCRVYIDGFTSGNANTWSDAFRELNAEMDKPIVETIPDIDDADVNTTLEAQNAQKTETDS